MKGRIYITHVSVSNSTEIKFCFSVHVDYVTAVSNKIMGNGSAWHTIIWVMDALGRFDVYMH